MTDADQNDSAPKTTLEAGLSAYPRGVDMGPRKSSALPALMGLVIGLGGGYFLGGNIIDMVIPPATPVAAVAPAAETPPAETAAVTPSETAMPETPVAEAAAAPMPPETPGETPGAIPSAPPAEVSAEAAMSTAGTSTAAPAETVTPPAETAAAPAAMPDPAVAPVTDPALAQPPSDLPVPANAVTAETAAAATPAQPGAPAATAAPATPPTTAEMAIVQNAAVLDQLSQPATTAVGTAAMPALDVTSAVNNQMGQQAIIRPLPKQYLIVKKNHDAGDVDSRLTSARIAMSQNRDTGALELFNELYKDYPHDQRILMGRAVSLQKLGQNDQALAAYEEVLNADPKNLEALTNMLGLLKAQNPSLATQKLAELQQAYPYNADIAAQLAISYGGQGSYDEALKYLDVAEALKPGSAYVLYNKAVLYDKMGRSQQAGELYRQIVRLAAEGKLDQQLPIEQIKSRLSTLK